MNDTKTPTDFFYLPCPEAENQQPQEVFSGPLIRDKVSLLGLKGQQGMVEEIAAKISPVLALVQETERDILNRHKPNALYLVAVDLFIVTGA